MKLSSCLQKISYKIKDYNKKVNWIVFILIVIFCIASWIDLNGMWCELPLMVHELPEGWRLPSIITVSFQIAQIGPFLFILFKWLFPKRISYIIAIYIILGVGAVSCLLLHFFWNKTVKWGNEERSIGLYVLAFTLGLLDGTSTVTFLTFIGTNFNKEYIIPNYIGESFSSLIPSLAGIIQGIGEDPGCRNVSKATNESEEVLLILEPIPLVPKFSVSAYFIFLFVLLCICTAAFTLLNYLPLSKNEKQKKLSPHINMVTSGEDDEQVSSNIPSKKEQIFLYSIILASSFIVFGVLPSLQSYSTLPYGNNIFYLSINLSFFLLPVATFLSIWSYKLSSLRIFIEFLIAMGLSFYIIIISIFSPCLPLLNSWLGPTLILFAWVVSQNMFMRIRCCIATKLEVCGELALMLVGGCTMLGQVFGAIMMFIIVDTYRLFNEAPVCVNIKDYCAKQ